eukprot:jgi/Chlat1/1043/Chrsp110S01535
MNQYHIYETIGKGQHSTVYKGRRKKSIAYFAVKSVDKSQRPRVLQEVRTLHSLSHTNVLRFYAWYETSNHLWLILEYCVGGDLLSLLKQDVKLPETSVYEFASDLVTALQYIHAQGIIYADLKPSNILLDENGCLKLCDFGLARRVLDSSKDEGKRGTPSYMAPELFTDGAPYSFASDLWALGCVLYECVAGHPPFVSTSLSELVQKILHDAPPPLPADVLGPEMTNLVFRLLEKDPLQRLNWEQLLAHHAWHEPFVSVVLPPQPAWETFVQTTRPKVYAENLGQAGATGLRPGSSSTKADACVRNPLAEVNTLPHPKATVEVNVMRLSQIVKSNLAREKDAESYIERRDTNAAAATDVRLDNPDAELDFAEQHADDEDSSPGIELSEDVSGSPEEEPCSISEGVVDDSGRPLPTATPPGVGVARRDRVPRAAAAAAAALADAGKCISVGNRHNDWKSSAGSAADMPAPPAFAAAAEKAITVQQLMWHASDMVVKPIVLNRRIEKVAEPTYDARALPFRAFAMQEMMSSSQPELESFLTLVYRSIGGPTPVTEKVNTLAYFESLCLDTSSANILINSSLMTLFVKLLRSARTPALRIRLCSAIGMLLRHATYIADDLATSGIVSVLTDTLRDKSEKVRRRAMATLGELIFYIATQQQDKTAAEQKSETWIVPVSTTSLMIRMLRPGEDEIVQHYAAKTCENIASHGGDWTARFATQEVAFSLVHMCTNSKNEHLRATAASTLARLVKHTPALAHYIVDKGGPKLVVTGMVDGSPRAAQAWLSVLNAALSSELSARSRSSLLEEQALLPTVLGLLDHATPVIRGKALLCILLLARVSSRWLLAACTAKLIPQLERLVKDRDEYVAQAMHALSSAIVDALPGIMEQVTGEVERLTARKPSSGGSAGAASRAAAQSKTPLAMFPIVLHMVTSTLFRLRAVTAQLISDLAWCLEKAETTGSFPGQADYRLTLMNIVEAISQQPAVLLSQSDAIVARLLPELATLLGSSDSGDTRFLCLKMSCDVLTLFVTETSLYKHGCDNDSARLTGQIDRLVMDQLLPLYPSLLTDEDPIPLFALKLLVSLAEHNDSVVREIVRLDLPRRLLEFLSLEHEHNNVHNLKLCQIMLAANAADASLLVELQVTAKVSAVLNYAFENSVEAFVEPLLQICRSLLQMSMNSAHVSDMYSVGGGLSSTALLDSLPVWLELSTSSDATVVDLAVDCIQLAANVDIRAFSTRLISNPSVGLMAKLLETASQRPLQPCVRLLQALTIALKAADRGNVAGVASLEHALGRLSQQTRHDGIVAASADAMVAVKRLQLH